MPSSMIKSFAEKSGKSEKEVESLWSKATSIVGKEYPNVRKDSDQYYALVTGTLKKMLGLNENYIGRKDMPNFEELVNEELSKLEEEKATKEEMEDDESDEEVDDAEGEDSKKKKKKKKSDDEKDESDKEVDDEKE